MTVVLQTLSSLLKNLCKFIVWNNKNFGRNLSYLMIHNKHVLLILSSKCKIYCDKTS